MHKNLKSMTDFRDNMTNQYRESGFRFFNMKILKFGLDESIPLLERINFIWIVLTNYMEHFGRMDRNEISWNQYQIITNFNMLVNKINQTFMQIDISNLKNFHIELPEFHQDKESDKDLPVYCIESNSIQYIRKSDKKNLVIDGIKYVPLTFIRDFGVEYDISEVGIWSEDYLKSKINMMNETHIPDLIIWINPNISNRTKEYLRKYMLNKGLYPVFLNVDLLNCVNYDATEEKTELNYKPIEQNNYHYDYFNQKKFCDVFRMPYDSFDNILSFYNQVIHNDNVDSIYITFYRTKIDKKLISTLIEGTHLGKKLNIYVELTARGDEENNFDLIKKLKSECNQDYLNLYTSYSGYKIHAKMGLVAMKDGTYIGYCGTGNFNEVTAKIYKDTHIITDDPQIINDIILCFNSIGNKTPKVRIKLKKILRNEIQKQIQLGKDGKIILVCNHIADSEIVDLLSLAKERGCKVKIYPRSTFGYSEKEFGKKKFRGGRFLEHERIYIFGKGNNPTVYLSSSDVLFRNLYKRMEFTFKLPDYIDKNQFIKEYE